MYNNIHAIATDNTASLSISENDNKSQTDRYSNQ